MNWEAIGAIGEVGGAIAVVATLVYLAVQIRQNTGQLQADAIIAANDAEDRLLRDLQNPELLGDILRASEDWSHATAKEQARAHLVYSAFMRHTETCFNLWRRGALDEGTYRARENFTLSFLVTPGIRTWWEIGKHSFGPDFLARIDRRLDREGDSFAPTLQGMPFYRPEHWPRGDGG